MTDIHIHIHIHVHRMAGKTLAPTVGLETTMSPPLHGIRSYAAVPSLVQR